MKYFFDNDISYRYAQMLRPLSVDVIALRDIYPEDIKDPDFLGKLKKDHGVDVFISNNTEQRRNAVESRLIRDSGVMAFYFDPFWSKLEFWDQALWLHRRWAMIDAFARSTAFGTCADIQQNGRCKTYHW